MWLKDVGEKWRGQGAPVEACVFFKILLGTGHWTAEGKAPENRNQDLCLQVPTSWETGIT